jgi:hypothetical protein
MSMHASEQMSERGTGGAFFAAVLMIIGGAMSALQGLAGILKGTYYVVPADYWITLNVATWGWTHLAVGLFLAAAGFGVMSGAEWARWLGIVVVSVAAVVNFMFIPIAPFWAMTLIFVDLWVIHSLVVHKHEPQMVYLNPASVSTSEKQSL